MSHLHLMTSYHHLQINLLHIRLYLLHHNHYKHIIKAMISLINLASSMINCISYWHSRQLSSRSDNIWIASNSWCICFFMLISCDLLKYRLSEFDHRELCNQHRILIVIFSSDSCVHFTIWSKLRPRIFSILALIFDNFFNSRFFEFNKHASDNDHGNTFITSINNMLYTLSPYTPTKILAPLMP